MAKTSNLFTTSVQMRLQTFHNSPLPVKINSSISNSSLKFAEAGFIRPHKDETDLTDQVECSSCGVKFEGWDGESPLTVHRTLNPNCPFLNTPPASSITSFSQQQNASNEQTNHKNALDSFRRQLFKDTETESPSMSSILNVPDFEQPFLPKKGGYLMLFESHRLLTFKNYFSTEASMYAEAGFIYDAASRGVICVFCNIGFDMQTRDVSILESMHLEKSPLCPFIRLYDVGNISIDSERKIRQKGLAQHLSNIKSTKVSDIKMKCVIKHPEFEDEVARLGTFKTWPKLLATVFSPKVMADAGFYYSGFMDKVKCHACGVGLFNWSPEVVPLTQHAKASPHCVFLIQTHGKEYIEQAQREALIVEADYEDATLSPEQVAASSNDSSLLSSSSRTAATSSSDSSPSSWSSLTSSPGSLGLDMEAMEAAMACQYTLEQISHAVTKFFLLSSGKYPNQDLLVGILKAADENHVTVCEKIQEIHESKVKEAAYQQEIQATKTQLYAKDQEIQATKSELQRTTFELQWRDLEVRTELEQQFVGQIQQQNEIIEHKDQLIEQKNQELQQNSIQLQMKEKEVEDLQRHIRSLQAELDRREQGLSGSDDDEESTSSSDVDQTSDSDSSPDEFPVASCKVCLVKPSQIVFLPCKHLCCCDSCASRLHGQNCPICRERNLGFEKVYVI